MKPIWKPKYSVMLSLVVTYLSGAALLAGMFTMPLLLEQLLLPGEYYRSYAPVLVTFYACCPAGWAAIIALLKLLHNIRAGRVFIWQNITLLRLLSWCFVFVALVSLAAVYWDLLMFIFVVAAGFLAIILRVVKNVMAEATRLREESDLTI